MAPYEIGLLVVSTFLTYSIYFILLVRGVSICLTISDRVAVLLLIERKNLILFKINDILSKLPK